MKTGQLTTLGFFSNHLNAALHWGALPMKLQSFTVGAYVPPLKAILARLKFICITGISSFALIAANSSAFAISVQTISGTFGVGVDSNNLSIPVTQDGTISGSRIINGAAVIDAQANGTLEVQSSPFPFLSATGTVGVGNSPIDTGGHNASFGIVSSITYGLILHGPGTLTPIDIFANGAVGVTPPSAADVGTISASVSFNISLGNNVLFSDGAGAASINGTPLLSSFSDNPRFMFLSNNTEYTVQISETIVAGMINHITVVDSNIFAWVDPYFTLAPGVANPQLYSFELSPGVGNSPATPLPATLPLFASGLGALGLLGWRRKRKNAALAA